jgi:hypothetical protein
MMPRKQSTAAKLARAASRKPGVNYTDALATLTGPPGDPELRRRVEQAIASITAAGMECQEIGGPRLKWAVHIMASHIEELEAELHTPPADALGERLRKRLAAWEWNLEWTGCTDNQDLGRAIGYRYDIPVLRIALGADPGSAPEPPHTAITARERALARVLDVADSHQDACARLRFAQTTLAEPVPPDNDAAQLVRLFTETSETETAELLKLAGYDCCYAAALAFGRPSLAPPGGADLVRRLLADNGITNADPEDE